MELFDDNENLLDLERELEELDHYAIEIGVFGSDDSFYAMIANVHEFGMTIKPKNGKNLAIPVHKNAVGKSPGDFGDELKPMFSKLDGETDVYGLGVEKSPGSNELEMYFLLKKSVNIPERSIVRSTFDEKNDEWMDFLERQIEKLCELEIDAKTVFKRLGERIASDIKKKITDIRTPHLSKLTIANRKNGGTNPLIDTGELKRHVTWKVVRDDGSYV